MIVLIVLISITIPFVGRSQIKDTVCMPRADAIRKLTQIVRLQSDSMELKIRKAEIVDLKELNTSQAITIHGLTDQVEIQRLQIQNFGMQTSIYADQVKALNKSLKVQKRKTALAMIAGILTSGGLAYLLITK